jgi:hypothetical protein
MYAYKKIIFWAIAIVFICSIVCHSQDIVLDFEQSLETALKQHKGMGVTYWDLEGAADNFISKHTGGSTAEFLETKIHDPNSRKLAILILAKMAGANERALTIFRAQMHDSIGDAVIAISYMDTNAARPIAEGLLGQIELWYVRKAAADILVGFGNGHSLEMLKEICITEKDLMIKKALESAAIQLEYRLTKIPAERQAEWTQQEIFLWRAPTDREGPAPRNLLTEKYSAANRLYMRGIKFTREYLQYKLSIGDNLAIAIIGNQRETWAVEELKGYAPEKGDIGDLARAALAKIGTNEALRALEDSLVPGMRKSVFGHVMSLLRLYGDETSAELMKKLLSDTRFSESERGSFAITSEIIEKRIAKL